MQDNTMTVYFEYKISGREGKEMAMKEVPPSIFLKRIADALHSELGEHATSVKIFGKKKSGENFDITIGKYEIT